MKKFNLDIIHWYWSCGDHCNCAEYGTVVYVYPEGSTPIKVIEDAIGWREDYNGESTPTLDFFDADVITDAIFWCAYDDIIVAQDFKKKCCAAFGVQLEEANEFNWIARLPPVSGKKAKEIFAAFDMDVTMKESDEEVFG